MPQDPGSRRKLQPVTLKLTKSEAQCFDDSLILVRSRQHLLKPDQVFNLCLRTSTSAGRLRTSGTCPWSAMRSRRHSSRSWSHSSQPPPTYRNSKTGRGSRAHPRPLRHPNPARPPAIASPPNARGSKGTCASACSGPKPADLSQFVGNSRTKEQCSGGSAARTPTGTITLSRGDNVKQRSKTGTGTASQAGSGTGPTCSAFADSST
jgi:hypothetical protein